MHTLPPLLLCALAVSSFAGEVPKTWLYVIRDSVASNGVKLRAGSVEESAGQSKDRWEIRLVDGMKATLAKDEARKIDVTEAVAAMRLHAAKLNDELITALKVIENQAKVYSGPVSVEK